MPVYANICDRACNVYNLCQPMPNLQLAYVSVYQRMSTIFIRNSYVSLKRNSVTGP